MAMLNALVRGYALIPIRKHKFIRSKFFQMMISLCATIMIGVSFALTFKLDDIDLKSFFTADGVTLMAALWGGERGDAVPVTIIDIDERSFKAWNSAAVIPRDKLAALLEILRSGRPRALVVDVDFSLDQTAEAVAIRAFIETSRKFADPSPVFFVRHLSEMPSGMDIEGGAVDRPTPIDDAVVSGRSVHWVSALFKPENDWFYRRWIGSTVLCAQGLPRAIPSVALATTAVVSDPREGLDSLQAWLARRAESACKGRPPQPSAKPGKAAWLRNAGERMTIPFAVGFTQDVGQFGTTQVNGQITQIFRRLPASAVLDSGMPPDVADRVVLVGASYREARDMHQTPLGAMPGVYVLANLVALGGGPLSEQRLGGLKPFLFGAALLILHGLTRLLLRPPFSVAAFILITTGALLLTLSSGIQPYVIYEGTVAGLLLITLHAAITSLLEARDQAGRPGRGKSWWRRLILSDWLLGIRQSKS